MSQHRRSIGVPRRHSPACGKLVRAKWQQARYNVDKVPLNRVAAMTLGCQGKSCAEAVRGSMCGGERLSRAATRHSRVSGNPGSGFGQWMPAFAGMRKYSLPLGAIPPRTSPWLCLSVAGGRPDRHASEIDWERL